MSFVEVTFVTCDYCFKARAETESIGSGFGCRTEPPGDWGVMTIRDANRSDVARHACPSCWSKIDEAMRVVMRENVAKL